MQPSHPCQRAILSVNVSAALPRKNPLPPNESAICKRLLAVRKTLRLSRVAFAASAGVDLGQLRTYEEERAPLKWGDAHKICDAFSIGQQWLATGRGLDSNVRVSGAGADSERLFSDVYNTLLRPTLEQAISGVEHDCELFLQRALSRLKSGGFSVWEQDRLTEYLLRFIERSESRAAKRETLESAARELHEIQLEKAAKPHDTKARRASKK